jgi:hypothetical protein
MPRATSQPRGAGSPVAAAKHTAATGAITAAIAALEADMHEHDRKAREARALLDRLRVYANGTPPVAKARHAGGRPPIDTGDVRRAKNAEKQRLRRERIRAAVPPLAKPKPAKKNTPRHRKSVAAAIVPPAPMAKPEKRQRKAARVLAEAELREIEMIRAAITAAMAQAGKFKLSNKTKFRQALDEAARARRRGGLLLRQLQGAELPLTAHELKVWRSAAFGDDQQFEERLATLTPPVQVITKFVADEQGVLSRTKTAIDANAAAPA